MGKHKDKVQAALAARQKAQPQDMSGYHFVKPGSQNKRKGYLSKKGRRG